VTLSVLMAVFCGGASCKLRRSCLSSVDLRDLEDLIEPLRSLVAAVVGRDMSSSGTESSIFTPFLLRDIEMHCHWLD
jgi:hypothetical protein